MIASGETPDRLRSTLVGYDGSADGTTITVANGFFVLKDLAPIADGSALPTVFNAADPDNPSVAASDFAWSTIAGRVDANGDDAIQSLFDCKRPGSTERHSSH